MDISQIPFFHNFQALLKMYPGDEDEDDSRIVGFFTFQPPDTAGSLRRIYCTALNSHSFGMVVVFMYEISFILSL